jgi:hypothetical protein
MVRDHLPELPALQQLHRLAAEARRQRTVERGGLAAALQVAEHDVRVSLFVSFASRSEHTSPAPPRRSAWPPCAASTIECPALTRMRTFAPPRC